MHESSPGRSTWACPAKQSVSRYQCSLQAPAQLRLFVVGLGYGDTNPVGRQYQVVFNSKWLEDFERHAPTAKATEDALIRDIVGTRCGSLVVWKDAAYPASRPRHRDAKIGEIEVAANIVLNKEQITWKDGGLGIRLHHDEIS